MDLKCNGRLLQLIECIESIKSDVKKKMMLREHTAHTPKSPNRSKKKISFPRNEMFVSAIPKFLAKEVKIVFTSTSP